VGGVECSGNGASQRDDGGCQFDSATQRHLWRKRFSYQFHVVVVFENRWSGRLHWWVTVKDKTQARDGAMGPRRREHRVQGIDVGDRESILRTMYVQRSSRPPRRLRQHTIRCTEYTWPSQPVQTEIQVRSTYRACSGRSSGSNSTSRENILRTYKAPPKLIFISVPSIHITYAVRYTPYREQIRATTSTPYSGLCATNVVSTSSSTYSSLRIKY
jgi:hypothetical protein